MATKLPLFLKSLIIMGCGFVMAFFGCLGALQGIGGSPGPIATAGTVVFIAGLLAVLGGAGIFGLSHRGADPRVHPQTH